MAQPFHLNPKAGSTSHNDRDSEELKQQLNPGANLSPVFGDRVGRGNPNRALFCALGDKDYFSRACLVERATVPDSEDVSDN